MNLPNDLIRVITSYLEIDDILSYRRCCKEIYLLLSEEYFWRTQEVGRSRITDKLKLHPIWECIRYHTEEGGITYGSHKFLSTRLYLERLLEKNVLPEYLRRDPLMNLLKRKKLKDRTAYLLGLNGSPEEKRLVLESFQQDYTLNERSNLSFSTLVSAFATGLDEMDDPLCGIIYNTYSRVSRYIDEKYITSGQESLLEEILVINGVYFPLNTPPTPEDYTEALKRMPYGRAMTRNVALGQLKTTTSFSYPLLYWFIDNFPKTNLNYSLAAFQDYKDVIAYITGDLKILGIDPFLA